MDQVPVWALSDKGDVLCRLGVSPQNPAVRNILGNALLFLSVQQQQLLKYVPQCWIFFV